MTTQMGTTPSQIVKEKDEFIAYQIDRAVITFGIIIDNALNETIEVEDGRSVEKYTLNQLLDESFKLPRPEYDTEPLQDVDGMIFDTV